MNLQVLLGISMMAAFIIGMLLARWYPIKKLDKFLLKTGMVTLFGTIVTMILCTFYYPNLKLLGILFIFACAISFCALPGVLTGREMQIRRGL